MRIGLINEAMNVMTSSISVSARAEEEEDTDRTIFYMADLQERLAHQQDKLGLTDDAQKMYEVALEMLVPLKRSGSGSVSGGELAMLEARMYEHMGDLDQSAQALRRAAQFKDYRDQARLDLAVMDAEAGRCRQAVPRLRQSLFADDAETNFPEPRPWLALARCLAAQGKGQDAARAAEAAAERTSSPEEARYATWLAAVATGWNDDAQIENLVAGDDIWASMAREQRDAVQLKKNWSNEGRLHSVSRTCRSIWIGTALGGFL